MKNFQNVKKWWLYNRKFIRLIGPSKYKFIGIDLSRQTNTGIPVKINVVEKLEKDYGATMIFIDILNFF